jgi:lysyl-tRNA synthetase, class I
MPPRATDDRDQGRARDWWNQVAAESSGPQVVNDSKTPSGRVHVGALRGVLIHDAVHRALESQGAHSKYIFGSDDYDPLDELPAGHAEYFTPYLGKPLCDVPAPPGSDASDIAEHYIGEFFEIFDELGVQAERYRMRDVYRSGRFDEAIDAILRRADVVRDIDRRVAGTQRPDDWFPLQVVCENCGRIGTTRVTAYDGELVTYSCEPDLVKWATGCGHRGTASPFLGNAKLSWKLEWVAKWHDFDITIEGAGKDHNTVGGSRDVASACLKAIFDEEPPRNVPYEFFLVGGAKMSSSRGIGVAARDMADFLPPELLRFLMIRSFPNRTVDFTPTEQKVVRLFDDFDAVRRSADEQAEAGSDGRAAVDLYSLAEVHDKRPYFVPPFHLVLALVQLVHRDLMAEAAALKGDELTEVDRSRIERRAAAAEFWLEHFADEADRLQLQQEMPVEMVASLRPRQRAFLNQLADDLAAVPWTAEAIQNEIFDRARLTPLPAREAFQALYRVLFARESGPRAGNVIAYLDSTWVLERLAAVSAPAEEYWSETALDEEAVVAWFERHREDVTSVEATLRSSDGLAVVDFEVSLADGKRHVVRLASGTPAAVDRIGERFAWQIPTAGAEPAR